MWIEVKKPGGVPTELQILNIIKIRKAKGIAICTDQLADVERLITAISNTEYSPIHSKYFERIGISLKPLEDIRLF